MVLGTGGEVGVLRLFSDPWRFSHRPVGELLKKRKLAGCSGASGNGMYFEKIPAVAFHAGLGRPTGACPWSTADQMVWGRSESQARIWDKALFSLTTKRRVLLSSLSC